jgi:hypothetical protein
VRRTATVPLANRNHSLIWKGYVDLARLYAEHGVAMDLNYLGLHQFWGTYLTGSDRPVRFVDTSGEVIDCFQQATGAYDDASVKSRLASDPLGEAAQTRRLMEDKVARYFSPLAMLSHPVSFFTYSSAYMHAVWDAAAELGMPLWSAFEWAAFVRARDRAAISAASLRHGRFTCTVTGSSPRGSLTLMVPLSDRGVGGATVAGRAVAATTQEAFGYRYALVPIPMDTAAATSQRVEVGLE